MMNNINFLEKVINNLENECSQLNQEIQEMYSNANVPTENNINEVMFNTYPTPNNGTLGINDSMINSLSCYKETFPDNNQPSAIISKSKTFDPIMISNGISETLSVESVESNNFENEKLLTMLMAIQEINNTKIINAPLGNNCNDIDFDMFQNLLSMQENSVNNSIPVDASVESIIDEIQNNHVSLLGSSFSDNDGKINDHSLEELLPVECDLSSMNKLYDYLT